MDCILTLVKVSRTETLRAERLLCLQIPCSWAKWVITCYLAVAAGLQFPKNRHSLFRLIPLQLGLLFFQFDDCDIRLPFWFDRHKKIKYLIHIWMKLMGKQNACGCSLHFQSVCVPRYVNSIFIQDRLAPSCKMYLNISVYIFFFL